jgi:hypothetical protein
VFSASVSSWGGLEGERIIFPASTLSAQGVVPKKAALRVECVCGYAVRSANALSYERPDTCFYLGLGPECLITEGQELFHYAKGSNRFWNCGAVIGLTLEAGCRGGWNA